MDAQLAEQFDQLSKPSQNAVAEYIQALKLEQYRQDFITKVNEGLADVKAGATISSEKLWEEVEKRYGRLDAASG